MPLSAYEAPQPTPIYSFAALKSKQREVKDRGSREVVHITENGNAAYVFCSEEVFAREKARAIEEALYEQGVVGMLERAQADREAGRVYHGIDAARAEIAKRRQDG